MTKFILAFLLAMATTFVQASELSLQEIIDSITVGPVSGTSSTTVATDAIADDRDSSWAVTASGSSVATLIMELAGNANFNEFGVYADDVYIPLFTGSMSAGAGVTFSLFDLGDSVYSVFTNYTDTGYDFHTNKFGFYLDGPSGLFHSDTAANSDGMDHMLALQGNNTDTIQLPYRAPGVWTDNEFILAWEDTAGLGDGDYNDFVVMMESVTNVPEPAPLALMAIGLLALVMVGRFVGNHKESN
jgi:hypothetical protein